MRNKNLKSNISLMIVLIFTALFAFASNPQVSLAEISVDSYCQLTIQSMKQEVSNLQELISLVNQYKDDPETLAQQEEISWGKFDQAKAALLSSFGTTDEEYILYMGKYKQDVDKFLLDNPEIKQEIDELSVQIKSLLDQHDSLKESVEPPMPPLS